MSFTQIITYIGPLGPHPFARSLMERNGFNPRVLPSVEELRDYLQGGTPPELILLEGCGAGDLGAALDLVEAAPRTDLVQVLWICADDEASPGAVGPVGTYEWLPAGRVEPDLLHRVTRLAVGVQRAKEKADELARLNDISVRLSAEHNLDRLLERILTEARSINHADAGTLYTVDEETGCLRFQIIQNDTLGIQMGGASGKAISLPAVPLTPANVSAYVALTGETMNIIDVYHAEGFDFSGTKEYDERTGYRCRSMLVVPMRNHEDEVIAVLQLINARKPGTERIVPFLDSNVERTRALASQAGIALTNAGLIQDLQALFEGLIRVMATAVDEKSPYTSGHIQRVTRLAVLLAEAVNDADAGDFSGTRFDQTELNELRVAGLLHDIGKIVIPEHIVDKATKLQTVYDRMGELRTRWSLIHRTLELRAEREKLRLLRAGHTETALAAVDEELAVQLAALWDDLEFLASCNEGGEFMAPDRLDRLREIASRTYEDEVRGPQPYLTDDELRNLSIARGTLLPEELEVIRSHAEVSVRLLSSIPFSRRLRNVSRYAGDHHECLNGTGYPRGKTADDLPLQSRILAVADIYDALTAADRPYKRSFAPEKARAILRDEVSRGRLDAGLVELFISSGVPEKLATELADVASLEGASSDDAPNADDGLIRRGIQPGLLGASSTTLSA